MKNLGIIGAAASLMAASTAQAQEAVIQPEYLSMSCLQVIEELNSASEVLGGAPERGLISSDQMTNLATNVGQRLALDAGHNRLSTGVGIAGRMAGQSSRRRAEREAAERERATRTWYYLSGVYDARDCDNRIAGEMEAAAAIGDLQ